MFSSKQVLVRIGFVVAAMSVATLSACERKCRPGLKLQDGLCVSLAPARPDAGIAQVESANESSSSAGGSATATTGTSGQASAAKENGAAGTSGAETAMAGLGVAAGTGSDPGTNAAGAGASGTARPAGPAMSMCGNNMVESGETCDGDCPTEAACTAADACLKPMVAGDATSCTAECVTSAITQCVGGDACCPEGCNSTDDNDCSPSCGNGTIEDGETCDPSSSCEESCDDGEPCTTDMRTGSPGQCNVKCSHKPVTSPKNGDGCCPDNGNANNDNDCAAKCGNGVVEDGETCDPQGSCETSCDDGDPCTMDTTIGDAASCTFECGPKMAIAARSTSDKCCPPNTTLTEDPDCPAPSGWSVVERGSCSGSGALELFSGVSFDCSSSSCGCAEPATYSCQGFVVIPGETPATVTQKQCGQKVGQNTTMSNIEMAAITSMSNGGGCAPSGTATNRITYEDKQTYCPVRTPRSTSCVTKAGDVACPDSYRSRTLLYRSYSGGGCKCAGCGTGVASGGGCKKWRYSLTGCPSDGTSVSQNQALTNVDLTRFRVWIEEVQLQCLGPTAVQNGEAQVTQPQTVCCP